MLPLEEHPTETAATSTRSLETVIALSDQALPPAARQSLRLLSIFPPKPHHFSEEAAVAVVNGDLTALDHLSDAGLLEDHGQDRYTLHQTIAAYAVQHVPQEEAQMAWERLWHFLIPFVQEHKRAYEQLDQESELLPRALEEARRQDEQKVLMELTCAIAPFFLFRRRYDPLTTTLPRVYEIAAFLHDVTHMALALSYQGQLAETQGQESEPFFTQALPLAQHCNDQALISELLLYIGNAALARKDQEQAEQAFLEALAAARHSNHPTFTCLALQNMGRLRLLAGQQAQAATFLEEALDIARHVPDRVYLQGILITLGSVRLFQAEEAQAIQFFQEALDLSRHLHDQQTTCSTLLNLGVVYAMQERYEQAEAALLEAMTLARQFEDPITLCSACLNLAKIAWIQERETQAEDYLREARSIARHYQVLSHLQHMASMYKNNASTDMQQEEETSPRLRTFHQRVEALLFQEEEPSEQNNLSV